MRPAHCPARSHSRRAGADEGSPGQRRDRIVAPGRPPGDVIQARVHRARHTISAHAREQDVSQEQRAPSHARRGRAIPGRIGPPAARLPGAPRERRPCAHRAHESRTRTAAFNFRWGTAYGWEHTTDCIDSTVTAFHSTPRRSRVRYPRFRGNIGRRSRMEPDAIQARPGLRLSEIIVIYLTL